MPACSRSRTCSSTCSSHIVLRYLKLSSENILLRYRNSLLRLKENLPGYFYNTRQS